MSATGTLASKSSPSFSQTWKADLLSGLQVFLIALPLCLSIALASGFPPIAGVITAIIGGLIVSRLNGSYMTIIGPAAGLIVVILNAVSVLGQGDPVAGYRYTLAAIVIAGVMQIVFGLLKTGRFANLFPTAAVHGMLAAIGITILAKQLPAILGTKANASSVFGIFFELPQLVSRMNPLIATIGLASLALMLAVFLSGNKKLAKIPMPMVVVAIGIAATTLFGLQSAHSMTFMGKTFDVGPQFLLNVPDEWRKTLASPDFSIIDTGRFWGQTITIALIASLESLLSTVAVDKIDPLRRKSNLNKDIFALGIGTILSGLFGGLPMISEIVRSSANVGNGGKTGWANFFHGVLLLISILLATSLLRLIPLTSLAAILVFTGFRLASPKEFSKMAKRGGDQLFVFVATIATVLATDLLIGIATGTALKLVLHFFRGVKIKEFVRITFLIKPESKQRHLVIRGALVFTNIMPLLEYLERADKKDKIVLDLSQTHFIDHTSMELMEGFKEEFAHGGGQVEQIISENHRAYANHPLAARKLRLG